ncbi:uncharacterized protein LOC141649576 [Silene latifolia]|uniref:uncharacterized protein LOC141649576 n=1 Tax=Silene latifolia TaxID=37657 RepID=UPI003D76E379
MIDVLSDQNTIHSTINSRTRIHEERIHEESEASEDEEENYEGYWDIGWTCGKFKALMWYEERTVKNQNTPSPKFDGCCGNGNVTLSLLTSPPDTLTNIYSNKDAKSKHFLANIRAYNMMFSFTSMGGKIDNSVNQGRWPYTFRLHGQNYHRIGSLLPEEGSSPKSAQLYIYDTDHEVENRMSHFRQNPLNEAIVKSIQDMLDRYNSLTKSFRMTRDRLGYDDDDNTNLKLRLIGRRQKDARTYNLPTTNEVAMLIIGVVGTYDERDLILEEKNGTFQRINELHLQYLAMQYPILFSRGEDRYTVEIGKSDNTSGKRKRISMREFFAFRIHEKLDAINRGEDGPSSIGKRIVLPSSFPNADRNKIENYGDAMANFVYTIEFQKRGLPHVHIVLWLHLDNKIQNTNGVDRFIRAEIPDKENEPLLYHVVTEFMIHGPCGVGYTKSP